MTTNEELKLYEDVSENHGFFFQQAFDAWQEMFRLAFRPDLNAGEFEAAKARYELARSRCQKEMDRLK